MAFEAVCYADHVIDTGLIKVTGYWYLS